MFVLTQLVCGRSKSVCLYAKIHAVTLRKTANFGVLLYLVWYMNIWFDSTTGICSSVGLRIFVVFIRALEMRQTADHPLINNKQKCNPTGEFSDALCFVRMPEIWILIHHYYIRSRSHDRIIVIQTAAEGDTLRPRQQLHLPEIVLCWQEYNKYYLYRLEALSRNVAM
jgi:hypothetical protein